jgi:hypothetical protein
VEFGLSNRTTALGPLRIVNGKKADAPIFEFIGLRGFWHKSGEMMG